MIGATPGTPSFPLTVPREYPKRPRFPRVLEPVAACWGRPARNPYGFVFYTWGVRRELPMGELKNYTAFKDRMVKRPAVERVMADEKIKV